MFLVVETLGVEDLHNPTNGLTIQEHGSQYGLFSFSGMGWDSARDVWTALHKDRAKLRN
jgi:hypothetical protein